MTRFPSIGLLGRIVIILTLMLFSEMFANTLVLERVSRFTLAPEEAVQVAGDLATAQQILDQTPIDDRRAVAAGFQRHGMDMKWQRRIDTRAALVSMDKLREQLLWADPRLSRSKLRVYLMPLSRGGSVAGSLELSDHSTLVFRMSHVEGFWKLRLGRVVAAMLPAILLALLGGLMIRLTLEPIRMLMRATRTVGSGNPAPLRESGPREVRELIRDFNAMQMRISRLMTTRTEALAAVGHDLRTPLTRMELAVEGARIDETAKALLVANINEMADLLESLQIYLGGEGQSSPPENVDLAVMAATIIDESRDLGHAALYQGPASLTIKARPLPIRRSLRNLVENAIHYAGQARLYVLPLDSGVRIVVEDDGPGIPEEKLEQVLQPFVRLDEGRARNTRGMGLGLAIADNAIKAEGGTLSIANRAEGGLRVTIDLPHCSN